jgi:PAS domain S-box-containing protein
MLDVTERKRAEDALRRHSERLESLRKIDLAIIATESVEDLINAALTRLQTLVPSERATLSLLDQEAGEITVFASTHTGETAFAKGTRLPLDALGAIGAEVIDSLRKGEVFVHEDISRLEDAPPALVTAQAEGVRSVLSAPLLSQWKLIGILGLTSPDPGAFHAEHVEIAGEVANQLAIAMRQAQLFDELKEELAERRRAEAEMRRSEARKGAILEAALDCVITIDHEGKVVEFNPAAERTFGYTREQVVGKEMAELVIPPSLREQHRHGIARYLSTGEGRLLGKRYELVGMRADGTEFPVEVAITRVDLPGPPLFTGYLRDITDRKRAEEDLRRTDEKRQWLLSRLVNAQEEERSRIAGDIQGDSIQVMTAVEMRLEVLKQALEDSGQRELLEQLDGTVRRAIGRLRNLLFELRPPALDREGLVPALQIYLQQNPGGQGTVFNLDNRLTTEPPPDTRVILYRIAQEALTNVRKHARAATVNVLLEERNGGFLVQVVDDGIGFAQEEGTRSAPSQLGLAALRERAEIAGGWCRIESAPGVGTTVEIWVPGPPQEEQEAS